MLFPEHYALWEHPQQVQLGVRIYQKDVLGNGKRSHVKHFIFFEKYEKR